MPTNIVVNLGPTNYTGLQNLPYQRPVSANPGWGCCPNPQQLVDGRIQDDDWYYGYAWTGGAYGWAGDPSGWKQATIDLGSLSAVNRAVVWFHGPDHVPLDWRIQYSADGSSWQEAFGSTGPSCRTTNDMLNVSYTYPSCAHEARWEQPVLARYVRYQFDDSGLFNGIHGWVQEIEVFGEGAVPSRPVISTQPRSVQVVAGLSASFNVTVQSPIPVTYQWLFNGNSIAGANASSLVLNAVSNANAGNYSVIVSNRFGAVASTSAVLSILGFAPAWEFVRIPLLVSNASLGNKRVSSYD